MCGIPTLANNVGPAVDNNDNISEYFNDGNLQPRSMIDRDCGNKPTLSVLPITKNTVNYKQQPMKDFPSRLGIFSPAKSKQEWSC
jgi:hypothetical protein